MSTAPEKPSSCPDEIEVAKSAITPNVAAEIEQLRHELAESKKACDILKKATAFNTRSTSLLSGTYFETRRHAKSEGLEWDDWSI